MRADCITSEPGNAKAALRPSSLLSLVDAAEAWSGREPGPCVGDDGPAPDTEPGISSLPLNLLDIAAPWSGGGFGPCVGDDELGTNNRPAKREYNALPLNLLDIAVSWTGGGMGPCVGDDGTTDDSGVSAKTQSNLLDCAGLGAAMRELGPCVGDDAGQSDICLKTDIQKIGATVFDLPLYRFSYKHRDGRYAGVMAQDVLEVVPEAVSVGDDGYYRVDYSRLGIAMERLA